MLSNSNRVGGYWYPIFINIILVSTLSLAFTYPPAILASKAIPMMFHKINDSTWIRALINVYCVIMYFVRSGLLPKK